MAVESDTQRVAIHILFDGPPGPQSGRFIDVEDHRTRESIGVGGWEEDPERPGWWMLVLVVEEDFVRRNEDTYDPSGWWEALSPETQEELIDCGRLKNQIDE